jgi:thiol:disulfide interchange protein DsbA
MMKPLKRLGYLAGLLAMLVMNGVLAQQPPVIGREYTRINPPQPVSSGNKIEVMEFFWYGCPHCYHLEPSLQTWLKRKPSDVEFRFIPGTFGAPQWEPLTRTYYALDAMALAGKYHDAIFAAIHGEKDQNRQRAMISDPRVIADWLASKGVDKQKFLDTYSSFAVNGRTQRSVDMTRNYDISGTPSLAVDGKYLTAPSMTVNADSSVNYERFFQVVDQLIAQARKERTAKK